MSDHYETCDAIAVAVAMHPETIIEEILEKRCYIETKGLLTRGAVIVDWFERYPSHPRKPLKIVTKVNGHLLVEMMTESVLN